jgi:hypothetical protein
MADRDDDLAASKTEGFKVGEKKTLEEYTKLGIESKTTFLLICACQDCGLLCLRVVLPVFSPDNVFVLQKDG